MSRGRTTNADGLTLLDARTMPYPAYCHLPEGAILRYDPYEDSIRTLAYPATPSAWDEAPLFYGEAPRDGWRHLFGCECERCRPEEGTQSAGRGS